MNRTMKINYYYAFLLFLICHTASGQTSLRGMYIDHFNNIIGNTVKEDSLLHYAQDSSYNYLALYSLQSLSLSNTSTANMVASFIKRARDVYGIQYVGAVAESFSTIQNKIAPYNNSRADDHEKFNVFNLEFEFWTTSSVQPGGYYCTQYLQQANCSCDSSGGFKFFIDQMHKIDSLAAQQQVISETYLGWFNQGQAQQIQRNVDRILLHAYRTGTSSLYSYSKTRLQYLASNNSPVDVAPIFSAEPNFMGPWLGSHSQAEAYNQYETDKNADNSSWLQYINLLGYTWFDWEFMPKPVPGTSTTFNPVITASGSTNICPGGNVNLSATHGDTYNWSNGASTQSITVNSSATVTCTVTFNGTTKTTPQSVVSLRNQPSVTITEGTYSPGLVPLTASATPGSGSVSTYQWFYNNVSIGSSNSNTYTATSSGTYAVLVTNSYGCSAASANQSITVSGTACMPSVPTGLSSIPSTETSQILSWPGGQSGDSIIVRYHPDTTTTYDYIRMANNGQASVIITGLAQNTLYSWRVKTVCGSTSGAYSSKDYFTTGTTANGIPHVRDIVSEGSESASLISVYPNPASTNVNVNFYSTLGGSGSIALTDINGRTVTADVVTINSGKNIFALNTTTLSNGLYFISINSNDGSINKKILISH